MMQDSQLLPTAREPFDPHKIGDGIIVAGFSFAAIGTVTAVWANPVFTRMTPIGIWEIPSLVLVAALTGIFAAVRRPACATGRAGLGGLASFLGIACPTCNKILMLVFGGEALMRWFDPVRPLMTLLGIGLLCMAIRNEWKKRPLVQPAQTKSEAF
jgi:hypothetical protein